MPKIEDQIAALERKMEQQRNRIRDLKAQATKQERKDETRRKLLYGAAYLAGLESLTEDARRRSLARVEGHINRTKDRVFLGLKPLKEGGEDQNVLAEKSPPTTQDLPFRAT